MDKFIIIYKILKGFEYAMSTGSLDAEAISPERLKIPFSLWRSIMLMLIEDGYIRDAAVCESFDGTNVVIDEARITLKGLEYLNDNTFMKRAARAVMGLKEIKGILD